MSIYDKGVLFGARLLSNEAMAKIPALTNQAISYTRGAAVRARGLSRELSMGASHLGRNALIGGGAGAIGGAGYNAVSDDRADWRSMTRAGVMGGLLGAAGGAGYSYGRSALGMARTRGISPSSLMSSASKKMTNMQGRAGRWWGQQVSQAEFNAANASSPLGVAMDARAEAMRGM